MKKKYIAPASLIIEMQTCNMLVLSTENGTTINKGNEDEFEMCSNKQHSMWGESGNKKGLRD